MTDRKQALQGLRDKVAAGETPSREVVFTAFPDRDMFDGEPVWRLFDWACDPEDIRAMGAVKALHDAVLHERVVCELKYSVRYGGLVRLWDMGSLISAAARDSPARAWLLAILSALIAKEETP